MSREIAIILQEMNDNLKNLNELLIASHNDRKQDFDMIHEKLADILTVLRPHSGGRSL